MSALRIKIHSANAEYRLSLSGMLSAACLFAGIVGSLAGMFAFEALGLCMLAGLGTILLAMILNRRQWGGMALCLLAAAGLAAGLLLLDFRNGFFRIFNQISSVFGGRIGRNLTQYAAEECGLNAALGYLSALIALGCVWLVKNRSVWIAAFVAAVLAALDVMLGIAAPTLWIVSLAAGVLLLNLSAGTKGGLIAWFSLAIAFALAVTGGIFLMEHADISGRESLKAKLSDSIAAARFGGADRLTGGDFSNLGSLEENAAPMLEITMDQPESIYLRGFVGSKYTGNGWNKPTSVSMSDAADLFYWLHQDGFYGQTQLAHLALAVDESLAEDDVIHATIRHLGASREYIYAPYELRTASDGLLDPAGFGDVGLHSMHMHGLEEYRLTMLPNQVKRYTALLSLLDAAEAAPNEALDRYLIDESHYNGFAYAHFLEIPEEIHAILQNLLGEAEYSGAHLDYGEAKQRILSWLEENIEYREMIANRLPDSDFLDEFLNKTRSGYDVHYASAAVMMMRYFGIPARYVEGYLITPERAESAAAGEAIRLSADDGHAWAEIYQDGLGWIPFETAPKYLNLMEQADVLMAPEAADEMESSLQDQTPQQENRLDMAEDFFEEPEQEDEESETELPFGWTRIAGCLLILLLLALLCVLMRRWAAMARRRRAIRCSDRKRAAVNLYAYLFELMKEIYGWPECIAPSGFAATVKADLGADTALKYEKTIEICEKAAFDIHGVLEEDYQFVYAFVKKTRKLLSMRAKGAKKLKLRYIRHLI